MRFKFEKCDGQNGTFQFKAFANVPDVNNDWWHIDVNTTGDPTLNFAAFQFGNPALTCSCTASIDFQ